MTRVLIVEDEPSLAETVAYGLEREGFECTVVTDGAKAVEYVRAWRPDVVLLDIMLPGMSGMDVCRTIRRAGPTPIIMVTAKDAETDRVLGLELGADDYVTKPFSMRELVARVRAVMRRTAGEGGATPPAPTTVEAGPVRLDVERHEVKVRGRVVDLPPKEFALLECLIRKPGKLMTRESLIAQVWGQDYFGDTRTLDVHVKRLRSKLEDDPHNPVHIRTVRGLGYKFEP
ncbi:MAG TPA: response regulator transcription factor [Actinomycetota bacterium]|nr:response regulator transcription factor [Actinomycetota bacterium]